VQFLNLSVDVLDGHTRCLAVDLRLELFAQDKLVNCSLHLENSVLHGEIAFRCVFHLQLPFHVVLKIPAVQLVLDFFFKVFFGHVLISVVAYARLEVEVQALLNHSGQVLFNCV